MIDYEQEVDLGEKRKTEIFFHQGEADPTVPLDLVRRTLAILDEHHLNYKLQTEAELKHKLSKRGLESISAYFKAHMQ